MRRASACRCTVPDEACEYRRAWCCDNDRDGFDDARWAMNVRKYNKTSSVGTISQKKKRTKMNPLIGVSRYLEPISRGHQQLQKKRQTPAAYTTKSESRLMKSLMARVAKTIQMKSVMHSTCIFCRVSRRLKMTVITEGLGRRGESWMRQMKICVEQLSSMRGQK